MIYLMPALADVNSNACRRKLEFLEPNMADAVLNFVRDLISFSWLTGPIFDKELRVSSRRRRNHVLRFAYLVLLTILLVLFWLEAVRFSSRSSVYLASRMSRAGQVIIAFIVWFQFCATQLVAVIMLSTSISDEIYHRTLGLLMTTPINSFQIVIGKLFSKLLQLILLLGISLPLLAIVRVFGGVPWDYVISSVCITLTAVIFTGSLSLFFSIFSRRAYAVIIMTILTLGALYAVLPYMSAMGWRVATGRWPGAKVTEAIFYPNPFGVMIFNSERMFSPRAAGGLLGISWLPHCGIMLAASAVVLFLSVCIVRRVALRQATGQLDTAARRRRAAAKNAPSSVASIQPTEDIRRIRGSPTLWKELRTPIFRGHETAAYLIILAALVVLFLSYGMLAVQGSLRYADVHMTYVFVFLCLGMLFTIVLPATCLTSEKESRSLPLLLSTTLTDWQIILGKFIGVLRRCFPSWLLLFGHLILFIRARNIHPIAIVQIAILVAGVVTFLVGTGLYFSSRFKRTTTAVIMNFTLAAVIWGLLPLIMFLLVGVADVPNDWVEFYMDTNPFFQALIVMEATAHGWESLLRLDYDWLEFHLDAVGSTCFMLAMTAGYILVGGLFIRRAKLHLRRSIF